MNGDTPQVFAFLVHPRNVSDIKAKYPILRLVPNFFVELFMQYLPSLHVSNIKGFAKANGGQIIGRIIALPLTARQMLEDREKAKMKVLQAVRHCVSLGASHVGLGAYTSVVVEGGSWLEEYVNGVYLTNGNALTALMSFEGYKRTRVGHIDETSTVAIIGATGSIGSAISKMIASEGVFKELYLVGRKPERARDIMNTLSRYENHEKISIKSMEEAVSNADALIVATSASGAIITSDMPKKGAFIYDLTQPKNVSQEIIQNRPDVVVVDGGLTTLPEGCGYNFDFGLPQRAMFSCMAETILLTQADHRDHFCLGSITDAHIEKISQLATEYGYKPYIHYLSSKQ